MAIPRGILLSDGESMMLGPPVLSDVTSDNNNLDQKDVPIAVALSKSSVSNTDGSQGCEPFLCLNCAKLLLRRDALKTIMTSGISFARSVEYLESGASICCMCSIYYELIMQTRWNLAAKDPNLVFLLRGNPKHKTKESHTVFRIYVNSVGPADYWISMINGQCHVRLSSVSTLTHATDDRGEPLCGYVQREKLDLASQLIQGCVDHHNACPGAIENPLPTRVLDLGVQDLGSDVRLLESKGTCASYVALSYCWGILQGQALSETNLSQYRMRIQLSSLPRTIQHAIQVTRALKVRYLWVDAYCIVQDCEQEKAQEISNMHHIYRNSFFTIAAAGAADATVGFLDLETQSKSQKLPIMIWNGRLATMFIRPSNRSLLFDQPLDRRAWALQECLLARRLLLFEAGRADLELHCMTAQQDERGEFEPIPHHYTFDTRLLQNALRLSSRQSPKKKIPVHRLCYKWSAILENFCNRVVSDPADKLSALAGVATAFHTMWGGEYYAGIWGQFLFQQLLWSTNALFSNPETHPRLPPKYRAPSWSWASIDGRISMPRFPYLEPHGLEFISCTMILADAACPFGRVLGGELRLRGLVKEAFTAASNLFDLGCTEPAPGAAVGYAMVDMDQSNGLLRSNVWCLAVEKPRLQLDDELESDADSNFSQHSKDPSGSWEGLLMNLKETAGDQKTFVRIGTFSLYRHDWFDDCAACSLIIE